MRNALLFILASILFLLFAIPGFVYGLFRSFLAFDLGGFLWKCAFSLDQTGNAFCMWLFNDLLIKKDQHHSFGNPDETVSHVLGVNGRLENLTLLGKGLGRVLNWIDRNHLEKAADRPQ